MTRPVKRNRSDAAVQLRLAGSSYDDIARTLGYRSAGTVRAVVEGALARGIDEQTREQQREIAGRRIERLLRSVWPKANDPAHPEHIPAVRAAKELIDRHARLYGLDEPHEVVISSPSDQELMQWVRGVLSYVPNGVVEKDVINGTVVREITDGAPEGSAER